MKPEDIRSGRLFDLLECENTASKPVSFKTQLLPIYDFVTERKFKNTLEVGLGIGGSACHILAATHGTHVGMDPAQKSVYKNLGLKNIQKLGLGDHFEFFNECSEFALAKLLRAGRAFEFIYIDGDHKFDYALTDFYISDFLIQQNGFILFDDAWMPSVKKVVEFIKVNRKDYILSKSPFDEGVLFQKSNSLKETNFKFF